MTPPPETRGQNAVQSTVSSLKEIVTIIAGLTVTNSVFQLLSHCSTASTTCLGSIDFQTLLLFVLMIINIIRFYHGNMRHLDTTYTAEFGKGSSGDLKQGSSSKLAIDFFVIFFQSLGFAINSFLLRLPTEFFVVFAALLVIDVVWFLSVYQFTTDRKAFEHQKKWTLNNTVSIFALLVVIAVGASMEPTVQVYFLLTILAINTLTDFIISWGFYFPRYSLVEQ